MSWRVFTGLLMLYLLVVLLTSVMTEVYVGSNVTTVFDLLARPIIPAYTNPIGGISAMFTVSGEWIGALFNAFTLNSPLFDGPYMIVKWFILTVFLGVMIYQIFGGVRPA
jgi:hypothetical protein